MLVTCYHRSIAYLYHKKMGSRSIQHAIFTALVFIFILFFVSPLRSYAVERELPLHGKLGTLTITQERVWLIDKKPVLLTAGTQIRNQHNHIVQPQMLMGHAMPIWYTYNHHHQLHRVWLLTQAESATYQTLIEQKKSPSSQSEHP